MDAADDIAFSTSDLEDSLKGGFMSVMDMLACNRQLAAQVAHKIRSDSEAPQLADFTVADVRRVLRDIAMMGLAHVSGEFLLLVLHGNEINFAVQQPKSPPTGSQARPSTIGPAMKRRRAATTAQRPTT